MTNRGFPHSEIPGSKLTYSSPRHIGVCPVLHRLLVPRHPPCALLHLTILCSMHCVGLIDVLSSVSFQLLINSCLHFLIILSSFQGTGFELDRSKLNQTNEFP